MNIRQRITKIEQATSYKYLSKITASQASQLLTLRKERVSNTPEFNAATSYLEDKVRAKA